MTALTTAVVAHEEVGHRLLSDEPVDKQRTLLRSTQSQREQLSTIQGQPHSATADAAVSRSWAEEADRLITECGIGDWDGFVNQCQSLRRHIGQPTGR